MTDFKPDASTVPLAVRWDSSLWPAASLYCLISRASLLDPGLLLGLKEGRELCASRSLLHAPVDDPRTRQRFEKLFGELVNIDLNEAHIRVGSDLKDSGLICGDLRFCRSCIRLGYHATLHQHWALQRCPIHQLDLETRCQKCGHPMKPKFARTGSDPFACDRCGNLLVSSYAVQSPGDLCLESDRVLTELRPHFRNDGNFPAPLPSDRAVASAVAQRFALWSPSPYWRKFKEEVVPLPRADDPIDREPSIAATETALTFLLDVCQAHAVDIKAINHRLRFSAPGVRLQGSGSAIATAFCKTVFIYRLSHVLGVALDSGGRFDGLSQGRDSLYGPGDCIWAQSRSHVRPQVLEILSLFSLCLVEAGQALRLSDIAWNQGPIRCQYYAAWIYAWIENGHALRIRYRANEETVRRLVRRYAKHHLMSEDDEAVGRAA